VKAVLECAITEYETFVRKNSLKVEDSPYLDRTTSIVFEYVSFHDSSVTEGPGLVEYHLRDPHSSLDKSSVIIGDSKGRINERSRGKTVSINEVEFEAIRTISRSAHFLFGDTPLTSLVYKFLEDDLRRNYDFSPSLS
jgi:hypothetical protein